MTGPGQKANSTNSAVTASNVTIGNVSRVLEVKRWEQQKGPFRGFDSPPGRF